MNTELIKKKILDLAIRGKLVEQRPEDGTAEELYTHIQEEKKKLIAEGKIKKEKPLPKIKEDDISFKLPKNWKWVRLGDLVTIYGRIGFRGYTKQDIVPKGTGAISMSPSNISISGECCFEECTYISIEKYLESPEIILSNNDIVIVKTGSSFGKSCIVKKRYDEKITLNPQLVVLKNILINTNYLNYSLKTQSAFSQYNNFVVGTAVPTFSQEKLKNFILPLPPLEEQKRIVAKIEEIFSRIDVIEKAKADLAKDGNLLEKKILDLAIRGKLVEQRPEEGSAEELYAQIQEEKQKLISEGKIKKEKHLPEITVEEIPFEIPESWKWVKLGSISSYAQTKEKVTTKSIEPEQWSLDLEDIEKETGRILTILKVKDRPIKGDKTCFKKGDILYSKLRPYLKKILIAPDTGICSSEIVPFDTYFGVNNFYLLYVLKSTFVDAIVNSATYGVKMPRAGTDTMINLLIPLPPLSEQKRIVDKIEELLPYCDKLK